MSSCAVGERADRSNPPQDDAPARRACASGKTFWARLRSLFCCRPRRVESLAGRTCSVAGEKKQRSLFQRLFARRCRERCAGSAAAGDQSTAKVAARPAGDEGARRVEQRGIAAGPKEKTPKDIAVTRIDEAASTLDICAQRDKIANELQELVGGLPDYGGDPLAATPQKLTAAQQPAEPVSLAPALNAVRRLKDAAVGMAMKLSDGAVADPEMLSFTSFTIYCAGERIVQAAESVPRRKEIRIEIGDVLSELADAFCGALGPGEAFDVKVMAVAEYTKAEAEERRWMTYLDCVVLALGAGKGADEIEAWSSRAAKITARAGLAQVAASLHERLATHSLEKNGGGPLKAAAHYIKAARYLADAERDVSPAVATSRLQACGEALFKAHVYCAQPLQFGNSGRLSVVERRTRVREAEELKAEIAKIKAEIDVRRRPFSHSRHGAAGAGRCENRRRGNVQIVTPAG